MGLVGVWWVVCEVGSESMRLSDRDYLIFSVVYRFRFCLGRHIKELVAYGSLRATDRRLKLLIEAGYLERKKYLFGIPYLYTLSHKARTVLEVNRKAEKIRVDRIIHDIHVIDTVIYFLEKYNLSLNDLTSEKELYSVNGFGNRKHFPDFIFTFDNKTKAVEIEIALKNKDVLNKNIKENYMNYDSQIWITSNNKVFRLLQNFQCSYPNMLIMDMEEILKYVRNNTNDT